MGSLTFKDFLPLIGTLITVIGGYRLISVQINKNRRAKWIDDFRREMAKFFTLATGVNKEFSVDKAYQLLNCTSVLILYLFDSKEPPRRELIDRLRDFQTHAINHKTVETEEDMQMFAYKLKDIMTLASAIILIEQKKI